MTRHPVTAAAVGLILAAALALPAAAAGDAPSRGFVPDVKRAEGVTLQGRTWTAAGETWVIHLRPLDDAERLNYIERLTGLNTDPFAGRPGQAAHYLTFLLVIENKGEGHLQVNPLHCWLQTNKKKIRTPRTVTDLSFDYKMIGRELPPAYERAAAVMLDKAQAVPPGETFSGLLVYEAPAPGTRSYHVDAQLTLPDGNVARMSAPYRRTKKSDSP